MKKIVICLAILAMMSAMVSCGSVDSASESSSTRPTSPSKSVTTDTTSVSGEAGTSAKDGNSESSNGGNNAAGDNKSSGATASSASSTKLDPENRLFGGYVSIESGSLNMRSEPNTNSSIIAQIPDATQLNIYSCDTKGWYMTEYNGQSGYVSAEFIKEITGYEGNAAGGTDNYSTPNAYGYYEFKNPPATSVSVASLSGTWTNADNKSETISITGGADVYNGNFTYTDANGNSISGYVKLEFTLNPDNTPEYWYTFYENSGAFWNAFGVSGEIPLNDIYAGQQGSPHYTR